MSASHSYESIGGIGVDFGYFVFLVQLVAGKWSILLVCSTHGSILGVQPKLLAVGGYSIIFAFKDLKRCLQVLLWG
ncbi:MAG: hypothetical protein Q8P69_01375 [bacterium]|nr:hypothetical protein [bacterium]